MKLNIRPWKLSDAAFVVKMRNNPDLMKWFRQNKPLTVAEQYGFMSSQIGYKGYIVSRKGKRVGVVANHANELCIVAPIEYHKSAIECLIKTDKPSFLWGCVLVGNPALAIYLDMGFRVVNVIEDYCEKESQSVGAIVIYRG